MDTIWTRHLRVIDAPDGPAIDPPPVLPVWSRPVTLLVHGYNNTEIEATRHFDRLLGMMESLHILPIELRVRSWLVLWQGYASIGGSRKMPAKGAELSYPAQIWTVRRVAVALKRFIDQHGGGNLEINIIAHSLGCRAVLELLQLCALFPARPRFRRIILMAAAVPVHFMEPDLGMIGEKLRGRLRRGATIADETIVLYSGVDNVLKWAFHAGQRAAGEGFFPKAVGSVGKPHDLWNSHIPTSNNHSDYFHDQKTAQVVADAFGVPVPVSLPQSPLAGLTAPPPPRLLATSSLPERWLTRRRI